MITSALFAMLVVPLWVAAPNTALIAVGGFLIQFFVQGCWGVIPAHINELAPAQYRGFFPGLAYQLGAALTAGIPALEAVLGEHFSYGTRDGRRGAHGHARRRHRHVLRARGHRGAASGKLDGPAPA